MLQVQNYILNRDTIINIIIIEKSMKLLYNFIILLYEAIKQRNIRSKMIVFG